MSGSARLSLLAAALVAAAACSGAAGEAGPQRHVVEMRAFRFDPATLTVAPGDTVVWINRDAVPHTATSDHGAWDSGSIAAGGSWSRVVEGAGAEAYRCTFHPTMRGELQAR